MVFNGIVADTIKTNSETTNAHKVSIKTVLSQIFFQTQNNNRKSRALSLHGGNRIYTLRQCIQLINNYSTLLLAKENVLTRY